MIGLRKYKYGVHAVNWRNSDRTVEFRGDFAKSCSNLIGAIYVPSRINMRVNQVPLAFCTFFLFYTIVSWLKAQNLIKKLPE